MLDSKPDLIDPYSTAHRTHASKVRCAAPAVVEGHISTRMMEDRRGRHEQQTKDKNITEDQMSQKVSQTQHLISIFTPDDTVQFQIQAAAAGQ